MSADAHSADLIVINGRVLTMDAALPRAQAVALKNDRIVAVGDKAAICDLQGPDTTVIDAAGGSVVPGFIESHMHLFAGAAELNHLHLSGVHGFEALSAAVRAYAAQNPDRVLLQAQSASYTILSDNEPPTRHHLDRIVPDRPFAMTAPDHHTVWANTKALEMAGLLQGRQLGPGNEIVMGADGLAEGELRESEAFGPILALAGEGRARLGLKTGGEPDPYPTAAELAGDRAIMSRGLEWCARHGITSLHNMDGNFYQLDLLAALEGEGKLLCRALIPFHYRNFQTPEALAKASLMAERYNSDWLKSGMVKFFMDGVLDSWTAVMVEPYTDRQDWVGEPLFTQDAFDAAAIEADRRGLQIAVHAIGDGAVRSTLDGYAAAQRANGRRDSRHRLEHIEVIHPHDVPRLAALGVIASMQPPHAPGAMDFPLEPTVSRLGRERWPMSYAWRTLREAGAHVVFASDWPVAAIDPIRGIQAAMRRKPWAEGDPSQHFTLHEALAGYTLEGAYAEFAEDRKGKLKAGYFGDLVVLSGDLESTAAEELHHIHPLVTICGGRITYQV